MTHEKILIELGGYREIAERLKLNTTTTFKWLKGGIPPSRWCEIETLAKRKGSPEFTVEFLAKNRPKKPKARG